MDARAGRPALLFEYCPGRWKNHHLPWGRARAADGRNVCAVKLMYTVFWMCFVFVRAFSLSFRLGQGKARFFFAVVSWFEKSKK